MATLTAVAPARAVNPFALAGAAELGDEFVNDGKKLFVVNNGSGAAVEVTFATQKTVDGEAIADKVVDVPNGEQHLLGPFPTDIYNDGDGKVQVTYEDHTSVTVGVIDCASV